MTKIVLDSLQEASEPVTSRHIILKLIEACGPDPKNRELVEIMLKHVRVCPRAHRARSLISPAPLEGGVQAWKVAS